MKLPYSDELNIGYLSRLFDNTTNCYKFFWFQAILSKITEKNNRFTFEELIDEMIADAWYMVTEYHLRLGPLGITDNLEEVVKYIFAKYKFRSSEKREVIIEFLKGSDDKEIKKYKRDLTLNVPYRLQAPFYEDICVKGKMWSGNKQILTDEINRQNMLMYYFVPWQYVAHDELWNLHPTTKEINSSKSNSLPMWNMYFKPLGELEYRAYELKSNNEIVLNEFNKIAPYHLNNQEIRNQLYAENLDKNSFIERLEKVIRPVYESAQTAGFREWEYDVG